MNGPLPISVKGVLFRDGKVVLLKNERDEWELPGGRPEPAETPEECLAREIEEELGVSVSVGELLDTWVYEVRPGERVFIATYAVSASSQREMRISEEHTELGAFSVAELGALRMPDGYRRSIESARKLRP